MKLAICALICCSLYFGTYARLGVDVSQQISKKNWECIQGKGYNFALVRIYQSTGHVDPNAAETIKNARDAGYKDVDGYFFPCVGCGNAKNQIKTALDALKKVNGATINQLWLDVEGTKYWNKNATTNIKFIQELIDATKAEGMKPAMYTSKVHWDPITHDSKKFGDLQLWYAHYDNEQNFKDFQPFGSWKKPNIKQFTGTTPMCDVKVDLDYSD